MSVQSQIDRIAQNIASAYAKAEEKGAVLPEVQNSENLPEAIASIQIIPPGIITMWSGSSDNIPSGWALCNGENNTPNLQDKFVLGAGPVHNPGDTGGEETVTLTIEQMPEHSHQYQLRGFNEYYGPGSKTEVFRLPGDTNNSQTSVCGGGTAHNNMPPYYALCYIMKL